MTIINRNVVIECPECKGKMLRTDYVSGNDLGATRWSNGNGAGPMRMSADALFRCAHCQALFWIADAIEVGRTEPDQINWLDEDPASDLFHPEWKSLPSPNDVIDSACFYEAIRQLPAGSPPWKEEYARTWIWWYEDQPTHRALFDRNKAIATEHSRDEENLLRLLEMVDATSDPGRMRKASILIALSRFKEAIEVLDSIAQENLFHIRDQLREAAVNVRSEVFRLR